MADNYMQKKCDFCGETIPVAAGRCPYCGSILEVVYHNDYRIDAQQHTAQSQNTGEQQPVVEQQDAGEQNYGAGSQGSAEPQSSVSEDGSQKAPPLEEQRSSAYYHNQSQYNDRSTPYTDRSPQYNDHNAQYNVQRPYYKGNYTDDFGSDKEPLSNGLKVFLTILFALLPGIGQLAGIITAVVFMNTGDEDRKSFGVALLVASLILFVLVCIGCFVLGLASQSMNQLW